MTKRFLALLLAAVMVLSLLPVGAVAEGAEPVTHSDLLHSCEHCLAVGAGTTTHTWTVWDGTQPLADGGHYVLQAEVTLSAPVALTEGSYVLCLNGQTIKGSTTLFDLSGTASLTITDCTAKTADGAYTAGKLTGATGSAVRVTGDSVFTMYDGIFTGNSNTSTASTEGGGAIHAADNGQVRLLGGELRDNSAGKYGGAVFAKNNAKVTLENMLVTENESNVAGALYGVGATEFIIRDSVITGNTGTNTSASGYSAAVYLSGSALKVTVSGKVLISGNTMGNTKVPDLVLALAACDTLYIDQLAEGSDIVFATPKTAPDGDDISALLAVNGTQSAWNCHWVTYMDSDGNTESVSMQSDGAFVLGHYHGDQRYEAVSTAVQLRDATGYAYLTGDLKLGGEQSRTKDLSLCLNGHTLTAANNKRLMTSSANNPYTLVIEDCTAYTDAEGVYHAGVITGGGSANNGGLFHIAKGVSLTLQDGILKGNTSQKSGAVAQVDGSFTMLGGRICDNKPANAAQEVQNAGALLINASGTFTMLGGTICNNEGANGGAIYVNGGTAILGDGTICHNKAAASGGAIYAAAGSKIEIHSIKILENAAATHGGGICSATDTELTVLNGQILKNKAGNNGGGLYLLKMNATFHGGLIQENEAKKSGGGLYLNGTDAKMRGVQISSNRAATGGGVYANNPSTTDEATGVVTEYPANVDMGIGVLVNKNTSSNAGGGIYIDRSVVALNGAALQENAAGTTGGGIHVTADGTLTLKDALVETCTAASNGGGIYVATGGSFTGENSSINANTSQANGGGLYVLKQQVTLTNMKFSGNLAAGNGGAVYSNGAALIGTDIRMQNNTAVNGGGIFAKTATTTNEATGTVTHDPAKVDMGAGTVLTQNLAEQAGSAIYITGHEASLSLTDVTIRENTAGEKGAVYVASEDVTVQLSGSPVITENEEGNLYLDGKAMLTPDALGEGAQIGIGAAEAQRYISNALTKDLSPYFTSDDQNCQVLLQEQKLFLKVQTDHVHCPCGGTAGSCDHGQVEYLPWDKTDTLPSAGSYYLTADVNMTDEVRLTGDLSLCLCGFTVTAAEGKRLLSTPADKEYTLTISDCTAAEEDGVYTAGKLTGGQDLSNAGAGAIFVRAGGTLKLYDGIITENSSITAGGAIVIATGGKMEMHGGALCSNKAQGAEGKGKNGGALFLNVDAQLTMTGGTICHNEAGTGGGIYVNRATATITGGKVCHNNAEVTGGGIQVTTAGALTLSGGEVCCNAAKNNGGGIYVATGAEFAMTGGAVKGNSTASNGAGLYLLKIETTLEGGEISGNQAAGDGGGMYGNGTRVTVNNMTFSGNKAEEGGAIYARTITSENADTGVSQTFPARITLNKNVVVKNNTVTKNAGGVCVTGQGAVLELNGASVTGNSARNAGGVLVMGKATLKMQAGSVSYNSANSGGGAYISSGSKLIMNGGSISGNTSAKNGGGIYALRSNVELNAGSIYGNKGESGGGFYTSGAIIDLNGVTISGNEAVKNGGAGMGTVSSVVTNGVKDVAYSQINLNAGLITENKAINAGGIIVQSKDCSLNIKGGKITKNTASSTGGGIYISTNGTVNMSGGEVSYNTAKSSGGIHHNKCVGTYTGGLIAYNKSATGGGMTVGGGQTCQVTVEKLTIHGNEAERAGGGILVQGNAKLTLGAAEITDNISGKIGGGICISSKTHMIADGTVIRNNTANTEGGGVYVYTAASAKLNNMAIEGNHSVKGGGGIFSRGRLILTNSQVLNNTCDADGGGIGTYRIGTNRISKNSYMTVEDTLITGNTCKGSGGGVYLSIAHPAEMKNVDVTGNDSGAEGGGIWAGCDLAMEDLTVTGNISGGAGYALYLEDANFDGESYSRGVLKMQGDMIVRDNTAGDMYLGETATISIPGGHLGENTYVHIRLASGLLTQKVFGFYDYQGGEQDYVITCGTRSMTEPEQPQQEQTPTEPQPPQTPEAPEKGNGLLVAGIAGGCAVIAAAAVVILLVKKKRGTQK